MTSLVLIGCTPKPKTRGPHNFTDSEWTASANALGAIKRAAEYRDADESLLEPRYMEAEKSADAAAIVLRDKPKDAKLIAECPTKIRAYRDQIGLLNSFQNLINTLNDPDWSTRTQREKERPIQERRIKEEKTKLEISKKAIDACISQIESWISSS